MVRALAAPPFGPLTHAPWRSSWWLLLHGGGWLLDVFWFLGKVVLELGRVVRRRKLCCTTLGLPRCA